MPACLTVSQPSLPLLLWPPTLAVTQFFKHGRRAPAPEPLCPSFFCLIVAWLAHSGLSSNVTPTQKPPPWSHYQTDPFLLPWAVHFTALFGFHCCYHYSKLLKWLQLRFLAPCLSLSLLPNTSPLEYKLHESRTMCVLLRVIASISRQ